MDVAVIHPRHRGDWLQRPGRVTPVFRSLGVFGEPPKNGGQGLCALITMQMKPAGAAAQQSHWGEGGCLATSYIQARPSPSHSKPVLRPGFKDSFPTQSLDP